MFRVTKKVESNVVSLRRLYSPLQGYDRGGLATPLRIRVPTIVGGDLKLNFSRILFLLLAQCYANGMGRFRRGFC